MAKALILKFPSTRRIMKIMRKRTSRSERSRALRARMSVSPSRIVVVAMASRVVAVPKNRPTCSSRGRSSKHQLSFIKRNGASQSLSKRRRHPSRLRVC